MADPAWDSVEVYLQSEGIELPTYRSPDEGLELESDKTINRLLYTQHKPDKPFKIVIKIPGNFEKHGADDLRYHISLDGVKTNKHHNLFRNLQMVESFFTVTVKDARRWDSLEKCWRNYSYRFANIVTDDSDDTETVLADTRHIGSIRVELTRVKRKQTYRNKRAKHAFSVLAFLVNPNLSESVIKGREISAKVSLQGGDKVEPHRKVASEDLPGVYGQPYVVELRYRTIGQLQALGCVPPGSPELSTSASQMKGKPADIGQSTSKDETKLDVPSQADKPDPSAIPEIAVLAEQRTPQAVQPPITPVTKQEEEPTVRVKSEDAHQADVVLASIPAMRNDDAAAAKIREEMATIDRQLALLERRQRLQESLAAMEQDTAAPRPTGDGVKITRGPARGIKREGKTTNLRITRAKRAKPAFVDLSDD